MTNDEKQLKEAKKKLIKLCIELNDKLPDANFITSARIDTLLAARGTAQDAIEVKNKFLFFIGEMDCFCNAMRDSILMSGNDPMTNMHWVNMAERKWKEQEEFLGIRPGSLESEVVYKAVYSTHECLSCKCPTDMIQPYCSQCELDQIVAKAVREKLEVFLEEVESYTCQEPASNDSQYTAGWIHGQNRVAKELSIYLNNLLKNVVVK